MSYIIYAKWDLLCIHKRRFLNTRLMKKFKSRRGNQLWFILLIGQMLLSYFVFRGLFDLSEMEFFLLGDFDLTKILYNKWLIQLVFALYFIITLLTISIQVGGFVLTDNDEEWLRGNFSLDLKKLKLVRIFNYVLYSSKELIIFILPISLVFLKKWGGLSPRSCLSLLVFLFCILELRILGTVVFCIYRSIMDSQDRTRVKLVTYLRNFAIFLLALYFGRIFSKWIDKFPIVKRFVDGEVVEAWFNEGKLILLDWLGRYSGFFIDINKGLSKFSIYIFIGIHLLFFLVCKFFIDMEKKDKSYRKQGGTLLGGLYKKDLYVKAVLSSRSNLYGVNYVLEGIGFWMITGLFTGLMLDISNVKIIYFLSTSSALYSSLFMASSNFNKNIKIYALDGEGRKISYWLGHNMGKLLWKKLKLWGLNMTLVSVVEYFLIFAFTRRWEVLLFVLVQALYCLLMFFAFTLPSIVFPYFNYFNINELREYADRKKLMETMEFVLFVVSSLLAIPLALYISESMKYGIYVLIQFVVIPLALSLGMVIMFGKAKRFIASREYVDKIYRG